MTTFEDDHKHSGFMSAVGTSCFPGVSSDQGFARLRLRSLRKLLCFAATPTFGLLALLSAFGSNEMAVICGTGGFSITGMAAMYAFMSLFHISPWLRLFEGRDPN